MAKQLNQFLREYFQLHYTHSLPINERFREKGDYDKKYGVRCVDERDKRLYLKKQKLRRTVEGYPLNTLEVGKVVDRIQDEKGVKELHILGAFYEYEYDIYQRPSTITEIFNNGLTSTTVTSSCLEDVRSYIQEIPSLMFGGYYQNKNLWDNIKEIVQEEIILTPRKYVEAEDKLCSIQNEHLDKALRRHTGLIDLLSSVSPITSNKNSVTEGSKEDLQFDCGVVLRNPAHFISEGIESFRLGPSTTRQYGRDPVYLLRIGLGHASGYILNYEGFNEKGKFTLLKKPYTDPLINFYLIGLPAIKERKMMLISYFKRELDSIRRKISKGESIDIDEREELEKLKSELNSIKNN